MVSDITNEPWEVPDLGVTTGQRACPACGTRMAVQNLGDVEIDRCGTCGIWFDADELGTVLLAESEPAEENRGIAAWLKRLFSR